MGFIEELCNKMADSFGITPMVAAIILGVALLLVIALIVVIIVVAVKKSKNKRVVETKSDKKKEPSDKKTKNKDSEVAACEIVEEEPVKEKPEKVEPVKAETVKSEPVKEEPVKAEPVKEESEPVEETAAPNKKLSETEKKPAKQKKTANKKEKADDKKDKTAEKPKKTNKAKVLMGKWVVEKRGKNEFNSMLFASNGELMLSSEIYSTEESARKGIETIIKGVENGNFVLYQDKNKNYYYKLKTQNNRLLCVGEIYKAKDQCNKAIESVTRIAKDSPVDEVLVEGKPYIDYVAQPIDMEELKKGQRGRWRMEITPEKKYTAKLYANNGQLMLSTEEVASRKSALNAVDSVKKNAEAGNFVIDMDKFGRYYYKLRNVQKSVICIGEAYETLESCMSAIESVRKFALYSIDIAEDSEKSKETK